MGEHKDHLTSALNELQAAGAISGMPKEPPEGFSKNARAEELLGLRRTDCIAFDQPCELGYHCPLCEYLHISKDGNYDERLHWSEYESMIWCSVCNIDYPSCLCLPAGSGRATDVFLASVGQAVARSERQKAVEADIRRMDYLEGEELTRGNTLFRRNMPITRAAVDAALAVEESRDGR